MLTFYKTYNDDSILQQAVAKLPWGHNILLIEKIKDQKTRFLSISKQFIKSVDNIIGTDMETF